MRASVGYDHFSLSPLFQENQHWNELIQDAQKRGAIIKTCDPNYRHDAMKILKLKPVLQRSLTHPPASAPEVPRPQGGLPINRLDSGLATTSFAASLYHTPSDADPERPPIQDRLRDPRLLRRLDAEARGTFLKDPQPMSPQLPDLAHLLEEPGLSVILQNLGFVVPPSTAVVAPLNSNRSPMQAEPPPAHLTAASTSKRKYSAPDSGLSRRRDPRAFSEEQERHGSVTHHVLRRSADRDRRGREQGDSSAKKRRFL